MHEVQDFSALTPLMKQYMAVKQEYGDAIVLFQVGDFYEIFFQDAQKVSEFLGIALTKRGEINGQPIPLCGFPIHSVDHYIPRLVKGGFKIALCDQLEQAVAGKMVARGVTNVLTPGTLVTDNLLDAKSSSYLFSFFPTKTGLGLLFSELLTSQLHATFLPLGAYKELETELHRFLPDEVVMLANKAFGSYETFFKQRGFFTTSYNLDFTSELIAQETQWLQSKLDQASFQQLQNNSSLLYATIIWKKYVERTQQKALSYVSSIAFYQPESFLVIDGATQTNLEIIKNSFDGTRAHSLLSLVDQAVTPMGSRMVKRWLLTPLLEKAAIEQRQNVVALLSANNVMLEKLISLFAKLSDIQRIAGRIALEKATLSDYVAVGKVLALLPELQNYLYQTQQESLMAFAHAIIDFSCLHDVITRSCQDDITAQHIIKQGYNPKLDAMRDILTNSNQKILQLEQQEIVRTNISSLKIRHNSIQGYYIEITKTNIDAVPDDYIELQTLVNRKRYSCKPLQILQMEFMQAQQEYASFEKEIFESVKQTVKSHIHDIRSMSQILATLDGLISFARVSNQQGWVRPEFHEGIDLEIINGKHPVVAAQLCEKFIPNDTYINDQQRLWIVTGPNMGGKSTYLRQVALICLLAQTGCFVPASKAKLALLDRIFTRIGAGDFLAQGKSTFLVEMEETAQILQYATQQSLIILDEVGRGTSTYDGLALAQAIVEHIAQNIKANCLFATHYHELSDIQSNIIGVKSFYADSVQTKSGIVFLHKIVPGKADGSFGIEVAKLAHIPTSVIVRAVDILQQLAHNNPSEKIIPATKMIDSKPCLTVKKQEVVARLQDLNMNEITPKKALDLLWELQQDLVEF